MNPEPAENLPLPTNKDSRKLSRWQLALLILVLLLGLGVRLFNLFAPPLDFHPVRQLRSALIARDLYYQMTPNMNADLRLAAHNTVPVEVLEPPILETFVSFAYLLAGSEILWIARLFSILFWITGGLALFFILRRYFPFFPSLLSLAYFLYLPFGVYASRAFQPDPLMVMCILLSIFALIRWTEKPDWKRALLTGLAGGITILIKVTAGLFLVGIFAAVILYAFGWKAALRNWRTYLIAVLCILPTLIYYIFLNSGTSSNYFAFWTVSMSGLLLTSKFYLQWLTMIDGLISLPILVASLLGILLAPTRFKPVLLGLWLGYILYGLLWPFQYTSHEYYHLMIVPIAALSLAGLLETILARLASMSKIVRWVSAGIFITVCAFSLWTARSALLVNDNANEPESWRRVGEAIPLDEHFVALVPDYGVRLQYYGWRKADFYWPNSGDLAVRDLRGVPLEDYRAYFEDAVQGADLFLVAAYTEFEKQPELQQILSGYKVYVEGNGFTIYDLTQPVTPAP